MKKEETRNEKFDDIFKIWKSGLSPEGKFESICKTLQIEDEDVEYFIT